MDWFKYAKEVLSDKRVPRNLLVFLILILGSAVSVMYYNNQKSISKIISSTQVIDSLLVKTTTLQNKISQLEVDFKRRGHEDDNRDIQLRNEAKNDLRLALVAMSKNVKKDLIIELLNLNKITQPTHNELVTYARPPIRDSIEPDRVTTIEPIKLVIRNTSPIIYTPDGIKPMPIVAMENSSDSFDTAPASGNIKPTRGIGKLFKFLGFSE